MVKTWESWLEALEIPVDRLAVVVEDLAVVVDLGFPGNQKRRIHVSDVVDQK